MAKVKKLVPAENEEAVLQRVDTDAVAYMGLKSVDKQNAQAEAKLKAAILPTLTAMGTRQENDRLVLETEHAVISLRPRKSVKTNEEAAKKVLEEKGLWIRATKRVIDEEMITQLHASGHLSDEDVQKFLEESVTEAFYVEPRGSKSND